MGRKAITEPYRELSMLKIKITPRRSSNHQGKPEQIKTRQEQAATTDKDQFTAKKIM